MSDNAKNLAVVFAAAAILTGLGWLVFHVIRAEWSEPEPAEVAAPGESTGTEETAESIAEPTSTEAGPSTAEEEETAPEAPVVSESEPSPEPTEEEPPVEAGALSPGDIHARLAPSTVTLEAIADDGSRRRIGAGFVVAPGVVATTRAVAERAARIEARGLDAGITAAIDRILRIDRDLGLALLAAPELSAVPLEPGAIGEIESGERIYALAGGEVIAGFAEGVVDSLRMLGRTRALTMSVAVPPGLEGGPVGDAAGQVIGVASRRSVEGTVEEIVISANALRSLLEGEGVEPERPARQAPPPTARPRPTEPSAAEEPTALPSAGDEEPAPSPTREPAARPRPTIERREAAPPTSIAERRIAPRDLVIESSAKLYERPDPSSHVIARLRAGTVVTAVAESDEWWRIRSSSGRRDGYLRRSVTRPRSRAR